MTLDRVNDCRDKDGGGDISRVAASFTCLRTNEIYADVKCLFDMLRMADHLREENSNVGESGERGVDSHVHD